jgi:hypothetical protein
MSPKDFTDKFGFALLAVDNVAVNPYHFPRKNDGSYTFQVDEARPNATTRDEFTNLTTDPDTVFDLVNPKQQATPSQSPKPAQSEPQPEPKRPGKKAQSATPGEPGFTG